MLVPPPLPWPFPLPSLPWLPLPLNGFGLSDELKPTDSPPSGPEVTEPLKIGEVLPPLESLPLVWFEDSPLPPGVPIPG